MKFWLTLVLSTIALSILITWLMIQRDAPRPPPTRPPLVAGEKGELHVGEPYQLNTDVIQVQAPKCVIGETSTIEIPFSNQGKGMLDVALISKGCGCVSAVSIDGVALPLVTEPAKGRPRSVLKKPNETGKLIVTWKPTQAQYDEGKGQLLIKVKLSLTDRRIGLLNVEIQTKIEKPTEGGG
jgi:hypothetical protein